MNKVAKNRKGFTLVETLVAITILVLVVVGTSSAIQVGISSYIFSKDQIIAFYLAQEGFEQIRNIRDENRLNNADWLLGIARPGDPCEFGDVCGANPLAQGSDPYLISCPSSGDCLLEQEDTSGFFGHGFGWSDSIFTREIVLSQINSNEISIEVVVSWSKGIVEREFRAKENLLNY